MVDLTRIAVSPGYNATKLQDATVDDKVDVFEDQVRGWILNHAKFLVSRLNPESQHCGISVLMIVGSYFESLAAFVKGESSEGRSKQFFAIGLREVCPDIFTSALEEDSINAERVFSDFANTFYAELRCGLFHEAMIRGKILILPGGPVGDSGLAAVIDTHAHQLATIVIDPARLLSHIENHFARYVATLRNPGEQVLRANFEKAWDGRLTRPGAVLPEEWFAAPPRADSSNRPAAV
jgi:hypothetical protein